MQTAGQVGGDDFTDEIASARSASVAFGDGLIGSRRHQRLTPRARRLGGARSAVVELGWRARIRTWNPLIQSQVLYR